jgi:predicted phage gp36 major capsid-like protein
MIQRRGDRNRQQRRLASANLKSDSMFLEKEARHEAGQISGRKRSDMERQCNLRDSAAINKIV